MDETALSTVRKPQNILVLPGKHQVGAITRGEGGIKSTCVCCMSAAGDFILQIIIFKRLHFKQENGAPSGTKLACTEMDQIRSICAMAEHFIATAKPSKDKKVLTRRTLNPHQKSGSHRISQGKWRSAAFNSSSHDSSATASGC
jgi:hypothetical protein